MSRIMLVDDESQDINLLSLKLRMSGFEVFSSDNSVKALELARATKPNLILMELATSNIDGIEVFWKLRGFSNAPVVFMSAKLGTSEKVREIGAAGFANKPLDVDRLIEKLKTISTSANSPYFIL